MTRGAAGAPRSGGVSVVAGAGALLIAGLVAWRLVPGGEADAGQSPIVTIEGRGPGGAAAAHLAIPAAARAPLPASLAGTAVDGGFTVDGAGHFIPDRNALRLFDYFLSARGEESEDVLRGRILLHAIGGGLREPALSELAGTLDRYLAYRDAARAALATGSASPADLAARVAEMRGLQRSLLGPELARAFYGDDSRIAEIDMQHLAVLRDKTMSPGDRQRAIAAIEAQLPPEIARARKDAAAPAALYHRTEALRASGASNDEIAALRRSEYGAGAAERLAALDRSRALWRDRLGTYRDEEKGLRASLGCTDCPAFRQAQEALRARHFSGTDLIRVRALDAQGR